MKKFYIISAFTICTSLSSQVGINTDIPAATLDVTGKPTINTVLDGIIPPRIEGAQLRAKNYTTAQTGALVYVTLADPAPSGQTQDVTSTGYYYFNGTKWVSSGSGGSSVTEVDGVIGNEVLNATSNGGLVRAGSGTNADPYTLGLTAGTTAGQLMTWNGTTWTPAAAAEPWYNVATNASATANTQSIYQLGRVGVNTTTPTEMIDNNGTTRLRNLPLNGTPNSINTTSGGGASPSQNQTFTAIRTVVADANGVLGYVTQLPSDAGTAKVVLSASVGGIQNVGGASGAAIPTQVAISYPNESADIDNAYNGTIYTVPTTGIYVINTQISSSHTAGGNTGWFAITRLQRSTNGGTNWGDLSRDSKTNISSADVDNGNSLFWTGTLNANEMIRVFIQCNTTTTNTVQLGTHTITRIAQ